MSGQLVQFLGSLLAILALAGLAVWLKLGPRARITNEADARQLADEAIDGFEARRVALDKDGAGALLDDERGRILLLKPHGTHFAARLLTASAKARIEQGAILVASGEKRFGDARLEIADARAWVQRIEAIR